MNKQQTTSNLVGGGSSGNLSEDFHLSELYELCLAIAN